MTGQDYIKNRHLHPFWDESRDPNREDVVDAYEQGKADGTREMKEYLMKEAVESVVIDSGFDDGTAFVTMNVPDRRYDRGDKVKLIVIKED